MIGFRFQVPMSLRDFISKVGGAGRRNLFSAAAAAVCGLVRGHVAREAARRHFSAAKVGGTPTGFLEKAARKTVFSADEKHGEVVIPSPGFGRAFHDVTISAKNSGALTLPTHSASYGRRVREVRALGWEIFRPKRGEGKPGVLMGTKNEETVCLYVLKKRVQQRQDRSLLPSGVEIRSTAARAMMAEIERVARKAQAA